LLVAGAVSGAALVYIATRAQTSAADDAERVEPPAAVGRPLHLATHVLVEGNIGAGKTTFLRIYGPLTGHETVFESVSPMLLAAFYRQPVKYALMLQLVQQAHRQATLRAAIDAGAASPARWFDRSVLGDYAFALANAARGDIDAAGWAMYREAAGSTVVDALERVSATPENVAFLYLDTPLALCAERQAERDGTPIDRRYLEHLDLAHRVVMSCVPDDYRLCILRAFEDPPWGSRAAPSTQTLGARRASMRMLVHEHVLMRAADSDVCAFMLGFLEEQPASSSSSCAVVRDAPRRAPQ